MEAKAPRPVDAKIDSSEMLRASLFGAVATALFYALFIFLILRSTYVAEMFSERGVIPYATTLFTAVGGFLLLFAWRRLLAEERGFEEVSGVVLGVEILDQASAAGLLEALGKLKAKRRARLVWNRFQRTVLRVHEGVQSKSDLLEMLRDVADIDYSISQNRHGPVKTIIWLIPILGFIGTVFGISAAIAGFSKLFEGTTDFQTARLGLSEASLYLGIAFETTLLALVMTAVLMVVFSAIQKRERSFLIRLDEFCVDDLVKMVVPLVQVDDRSETAQLTEAVLALDTTLSGWTPRFAEHFDDFFTRLDDKVLLADTTLARRTEDLGAILERRVEQRRTDEEAYAALVAAQMEQRRTDDEAFVAMLAAQMEQRRSEEEAFDAMRGSRLEQQRTEEEAFDAMRGARMEQRRSDEEAFDAMRGARMEQRRSDEEALAAMLGAQVQAAAVSGAQFIQALRDQAQDAEERTAEQWLRFAAELGHHLAAERQQLLAELAAQIEEVHGVFAEAGRLSAEHRRGLEETVARHEGASDRTVAAALGFAAAVDRIGAVEDSLERSVQAVTSLQEFQDGLVALRDTAARLPEALERLARPRRVTLIEAPEELDA